MDQRLATTAGSAQRRVRSESEDGSCVGEGDFQSTLYYTAKEPVAESRGAGGEVIARLVQQIDELTARVEKLQTRKEQQGKKLLRFLNTTESESGSEREVDFQLREERPRSNARRSWERDLPRLTKVLKTKELDPKDERDFEEVMDEWELRCRGCGMSDEVLKHLPLHLGSPSVTHAVRTIRLDQITWDEMKDEIARSLFPFSDYVREVEQEMEKIDRTQPIAAAVARLTRLSERHRVLCRRWQRKNTFKDDRMKEALLLKLPKDKIAACLMIPNFKDVGFDAFVHHCQMVLAAAAVENAEGKPARTSKKDKEPPAKKVAAVEVAALDASAPSASRPPMPADQKCPNCALHGHYLRDCPHPRVKCDVCGRSGHRKEICFKAQKEAPNGKLRTSYLRMTRSGIHIDLIDEATKKSLFKAMRRHLEGQEAQYAKAKERAAVRRAERKQTTSKSNADDKASPSSEEEEVSMAAVVDATPAWKDSEVNATEPRNLDEVPNTKYVDVEIFDQKIPGLLDSGAVVSLLPATVWNRIPGVQREVLATTEVGDRPLTGLGGKLEVKTIADVPIAVSGNGLLQRFFVSPNAGSIILGMDALKGLGITIDFHTREVVFNGESRPIPESAMVGVSPLCVSLVKVPAEEELMRRGAGCSDEEAFQAKSIFRRFPEIWREPKVGACKLTTHCINTGEAQPIAVRARRLPPEKLKELQRQLKELQESGVIQRSESPWASAVVLVPKSNGKIRLCVDYRKLNSVTQRDLYPLPHITELLDRLGRAQVFSTLDHTAGFHQILLDPSSHNKTAFITPEGLYEFRVLPFGLTNAPSTFQRAMDRLFQNHPIVENVGIYMDDIVVHTATPEEHAKVLEQVCARLKEAALYVNLEKTVVFAREVKYLGFVVGGGVVKPDPEQIRGLTELQPPADVTGVRRFLGLAGYFRRFIPSFSEKALPLTRLLKKGTPFDWDSDCRAAWSRLREELGDRRCGYPYPSRIKSSPWIQTPAIEPWERSCCRRTTRGPCNLFRMPAGPSPQPRRTGRRGRRRPSPLCGGSYTMLPTFGGNHIFWCGRTTRAFGGCGEPRTRGLSGGP